VDNGPACTVRPACAASTVFTAPGSDLDDLNGAAADGSDVG
jgi:hypothetical protein